MFIHASQEDGDVDERYVRYVGPNGKVLLKSGFFAL